MALYPVAGCRIFIGGVLEEKDDDFVLGDFAGQVWTEIKKWTQMGPIGDSSQLITSDIINVARTKKIKGTKNAGSMQNIFNVEDTDPGQIAMVAASQTGHNYAFKVMLNDAPAVGGSPTPSERYFVGLVMTAQEQGGGANTVRAMDATVEINSNIVRVAASGSASAPTNTSLPTITGTAEVDEVLTVTPGVWTGSPAPSLTYAWLSDGVGTGATGLTYTIVAGDIGKVITVAEIGTNSAGSRMAISAPTAAVTS